MTMMRATVFALAALALLASSLAIAQTQPPPLYVLLPFSYEGSLLRVCRTEYGVCAIHVNVQPGTPCQCQAANGQWLPGVCVR
jgi:hypothetical protein